MPSEEQKQLVVRQASRKYQRAAQVAADAAGIMLLRLEHHKFLRSEIPPIVAAVLPTITEAILEDQDILDPEEEE